MHTYLIPDNSAVPDKVVAFWKIYDGLVNEQKGSYTKIDKNTVSGQELKQRLVSSGLFYTSDAAMMIEEMVGRGKLRKMIVLKEKSPLVT